MLRLLVSVRKPVSAPWQNPSRGPTMAISRSLAGSFLFTLCPMSLIHIRAQQFLILYQDTFRSSTYASHRSLPSNLNNFSQSIWCGLKSSRAEISRVILYFASCAWRYATDMENCSWMCDWCHYRASVELRQVFMRSLILFCGSVWIYTSPPLTNTRSADSLDAKITSPERLYRALQKV